MINPKLVILAAGMGSRYGGLKQMDSMDEYDDKIIDFSMYDAKRAGFKDVVFIIKNEIKDIFIEKVGKRVEKYLNVQYVYQELAKLPEGFKPFSERVKPWGTAHALYCAREAIGDAPFAVINSDDFYGKVAYEEIYKFLTTDTDDNSFAMVGYELLKTLTDNGSVARGVCQITNGMLTDIVERTQIIKTTNGGAYTLDNGLTYHDLPSDSLVSMNFWGFKKGIFTYMEEEFINFLNSDIVLTSEFYIPKFVDYLIKSNKATVKVLRTTDKWFGVTYKEDKEYVVNSIKELKKQGIYEEQLWK